MYIFNVKKNLSENNRQNEKLNTHTLFVTVRWGGGTLTTKGLTARELYCQKSSVLPINDKNGF